MDAAEILTAIFSVLALGVSILVGSRQLEIAKRQTIADEKIARIEQERRAEEVADRRAQEVARVSADLDAKVNMPEANSRPKWRVTNAGPATADGVRVTVLKLSDPAHIQLHEGDVIALGSIDGRDSWESSVRVTGLSEVTATVSVTWTDGRGEQSIERDLHFTPSGNARVSTAVLPKGPPR